MTSFGIESRWADDTVHLRVWGELDIAAADRLVGQVEAARRASARVAAVDLHGITFMDSSGLRALLAVQRLTDDDAGFEVLLTRPSAPVRSVIAITRTEPLLGLAPDSESAAAGLA